MIDHSICGELSEEMIDRILADSFPASDPPPWTGGRENKRCSGFVDDSTATMGTQGSNPLRCRVTTFNDSSETARSV
jgi:hypothetical protein